MEIIMNLYNMETPIFGWYTTGRLKSYISKIGI